MNVTLPRQNSGVVDGNGRFLPEWYKALNSLAASAAASDANDYAVSISKLNAQMTTLNNTVGQLARNGGTGILGRVGSSFVVLSIGDSEDISLSLDLTAAKPQLTANLIEITATALTDLSYPNVVAMDGEGNAYYPDLTNPTDVARIVGITKNAAAAGASVTITQNHTFTETAWNWSPGRIYCGADGALTQIVPTAGALVEVARVISPTTIRVGIQVGILRAA